jgi:hypothetical protein
MDVLVDDELEMPERIPSARRHEGMRVKLNARRKEPA